MPHDMKGQVMPRQSEHPKSVALQLVLLLGLVSALGDRRTR